MEGPPRHRPAMVEEVLEYLADLPAGLVVDATVGGGGHAAALLAACPRWLLVGIDRDPEALAASRQRLAPWASRVELVRADFRQLPLMARRRGWWPVRAVLADLGVSSLQLERAERGFSIRREGPLDMRMDPRTRRTAAHLVNELPEAELASLLRRYGEERHAGRIARAIVEARRRSPLRTTGELARVVATAVPGGPRRIHPATRTFQALRIAVNDELSGLYGFVVGAGRLLAPGGRLAVISFHSLEDRVVKHAFRYLASDCVCDPRLPRCGCAKVAEAEILTPRPRRPRPQEVEANPRVRSARLRVLRRR